MRAIANVLEGKTIKLTALHVAVISFDRDVAIKFQRSAFSLRSKFGEGISISRIDQSCVLPCHKLEVEMTTIF